MAIPELYAGANINPDTHTFAAWLNRTNQLSDDMAYRAVTVNNTAVGGLTTGNAQVTGSFAATILATPTLKGGTVNTDGNITVVSNLVTNEHVSFTGSKNITAVAGNVSITAANWTSNVTSYSFTGTTLGVNVSSLSLHGTGSFALAGNIVSSGGILVNGPYLNANGMFEVSTSTAMSVIRPLTATAGITTTNIIASGISTTAGNTTVNGRLLTHTSGFTSDNAGNFTVSRPLVASNTSTFTGAVTANNTTTLNGNTVVTAGSFTANVTGTATIDGTAAVVVRSTSNVWIQAATDRVVHVNTTQTKMRSGNAIVTATAANNTIQIEASTSVDVTTARVSVPSILAANVAGNIDLLRPVVANSGLTVSTITASGIVALSANTTISGRLLTHTSGFISDNAGNFTVSRPLVASSTSTFTGAITANNTATLNGNTVVTAGFFTANVTGTATIDGTAAVVVKSANVYLEAAANKSLQINATASVLKSNTVAISAFSANNTIVVDAGTSIDLNTARVSIPSILAANVAGNIDLLRPVNITGALSTAAVTIGSTLQVSGTTTLSGSLSVQGLSTLSANTTVSGRLLTHTSGFTSDNAGNFTVSRPLAANSGLTTTTATINGLLTTSGNLVASGAQFSWADIFNSSKTGDFNVLRPLNVSGMATMQSANVSTDLVVGGNAYISGDLILDSDINLALDESTMNRLTVTQTANIARLTGITMIDTARMGPAVAALPANDGNFSYVANRGLVVHRALAPAGTHTVWDTNNVEAGSNIAIAGNGVNALSGKISISVTGGPGSGLHADLLDGQQGSYYLDAGNLTGTLPADVIPTTVVKTSGNQTIAGTKTFSSTIVGSVSGSAASLTTSRTINGTAFNGTANVSIPNRFTKMAPSASIYPLAIGDILQATLQGQADNTQTFASTWVHPDLAVQTSTATIFASHFNITSDRGLKTNIGTIKNALSKVESLRGVDFEWKTTGDKSIGVIAQEVQEVLPELVKSNGTNLTVDYGPMVGLLIEAVKELSARVKELESR